MKFGINREVGEHLLKMLESSQPYPVHIINRSGIIVASSLPQCVGRQHPEALSLMDYNSRKVCQAPLRTIEQSKTLCCITVRNVTLGAIELIRLPNADAAYLSMAKTIVRLVLQQQILISESKLSHVTPVSHLLSVLVGIHPKDSATFCEQLQQNGIDPTVPRTPILFQLTKPKDPLEGGGSSGLILDDRQLQYAVIQTLEQLRDYFHDRNDLILSDATKQNALVLCSDRSNIPDTNVIRLYSLCEMVGKEAERVHCIQVRALLGSRCCSLTDYEQQYEHLTNLLDSCQMLYPEQSVIFGPSVVLGNMVFNTDEKQRQKTVHYVFGKLLASRQHALLLDTLQMYFDCNLNATLTAQRLFIHRNTLQHRLRRLEELTGFHLHNVDELLTLRLAVLCYNSLKDPKEVKY